jgi:hypothetical protein
MMASAFDQVRAAVAKVDALTHTIEAMLDDTDWNDEDRRLLERLVHFVGAVAETAAAAVVVIERISAILLDRRSRRDAEPEKR